MSEKHELLFPEDQDGRKGGPEYPADYNEMFEHAAKQAELEKEQRDSDVEKIANLKKSILEDTENRRFDSSTAPTEKTTAVFKPAFEAPKEHSWLKRVVFPRLVALIGLLPAKEALGQQSIATDKHQPKTEKPAFTRNPVTDVEMAQNKEAFYRLSDKTKESWNMYIDFLREQGLANNKGGPGSSKLNSKAFAQHTMQAWIDKMNASDPGAIDLRVDMVNDIQRALIYYEEHLDKLEMEAEAKGKTILLGSETAKNVQYMEGLKHTDYDNIAGPFTTMYKFPEYILNKTITNPTIHGRISDKLEYRVGLEGKKDIKKKIDKGFADPSVSQSFEK